MRELKIKLITYFFDNGMNYADDIINATREIVDDELMGEYVQRFVNAGRDMCEAIEEARRLVDYVNE